MIFESDFESSIGCRIRSEMEMGWRLGAALVLYEGVHLKDG